MSAFNNSLLKHLLPLLVALVALPVFAAPGLTLDLITQADFLFAREPAELALQIGNRDEEALPATELAVKINAGFELAETSEPEARRNGEWRIFSLGEIPARGERSLLLRGSPAKDAERISVEAIVRDGRIDERVRLLRELSVVSAGPENPDLGGSRREIEQSYKRVNRISQKVGGVAEWMAYSDGELEVDVTFWKGRAVALEYEREDDRPFTDAEVDAVLGRTVAPARLPLTQDATYRQYRLSPDGLILARIHRDEEKRPVKVVVMTPAFFEEIEYPKYRNAFPSINAGLADLELTRQGLPVGGMVGETLDYEVIVRNLGPEPARGATLTEYVSNQQFLEIRTDFPGAKVEFRDRDNKATVALGEMAVGASATIRFKLRLAAAGRLILTSSTGTDTVDPDSTNSRIITRDATQILPAP